MRAFMCALLESLRVLQETLRDEMIVLEKVLLFVAHLLMFVVCKAPTSVEYTEPRSCSSNQLYQISNLSCVDCAANLVKANNGMFVNLAYNISFIGVYLLE